MHKHICPTCGNIWEHDPNEAIKNRKKSHTCNKCGRLQFRVAGSRWACTVDHHYYIAIGSYCDYCGDKMKVGWWTRLEARFASLTHQQ